MSEFDSGVFGYSQLKTEEYFRELWRDVSEVTLKPLILLAVKLSSIGCGNEQ